MDIDDLGFRKGVVKAALTAPEREELLAQIPGWRVVADDQVEMLEREFEFADFSSALSFANRVGEIAEAWNHHPALTVTWGNVKVAWWTHTAAGVTVNDIVLARETQALAPD